MFRCCFQQNAVGNIQIGTVFIASKGFTLPLSQAHSILLRPTAGFPVIRSFLIGYLQNIFIKQIRAHPLLVDHCKISAGMKSQMGNTGALLTPRGINKPNHKNQEKGRSRPKGLPNPSAVFCDLTSPEKLSTAAGKDP